MIERIIRGLRGSTRPSISASDVRLVFELFLLKLATGVLPENRWLALCRLIGAPFDAVGPIAEKVQTYFSSSADEPRDAAAVARDVGAMRREHFMQVLSVAGRGGSGRQHLRSRLAGEEVLRAALANQRGAVIWLAHFVFAPLASKVALANAGYRAWHLSRLEHGFSKTRFGIALLNPIRWRAEERFLAGRVIIERRNPAAATLRAARLLADNAIVSLTAGDWEGARILQVPFGPGILSLANGAPALAHLAGAALIPAIAVRAPQGVIEVLLDQPVNPDRSLPRSAWVDAATLEFVERIRPFVARYPEQWRDWGRWRPRAVAEGTA